MAAGFNNMCWFYTLDTDPGNPRASATAKFVCDRQYTGTVDELVMNDRVCAARTGGQVYLHDLYGEGDPNASSDQVFPDQVNTGWLL